MLVTLPVRHANIFRGSSGRLRKCDDTLFKRTNTTARSGLHVWRDKIAKARPPILLLFALDKHRGHVFMRVHDRFLGSSTAICSTRAATLSVNVNKGRDFTLGGL
jgi:hypothetical protein